MSELQEITPIYLYGQVPPTVDDGALFHYTTFDSFIKILETMTLRSSPLSRMNDLNEACLACVDWSKKIRFYLNAETYIREECSVISFTRNYMTNGCCQEGSNHPAMWAHYGENSNGVCIVLDQETLIDNNKELLTNYFHKLDDIDYLVNCTPDDSITNVEYASLSDFVSKNYKELFFKKHTDWAYEKETRLLVETPRIYLNIKGAIKYIVLGAKISMCKEKLERIIELMVAPGNTCYNYLNIHSFAQMLIGGNGYLTVDASPVIFQRMREMASTSVTVKSYLDWCYDSGKTSLRR